MNYFRLASVTALFLPTLAFATTANAAILKIDQSAFMPEAGLITFNEVPVGTINPTYAPSLYGGVSGIAPTVNFGGFFSGQSLGTAATCPTGAALTGCVIGTPSASLSLSASSPATFTVNDASATTNPVLSGTPRFNGAVSILFDRDLAGVGLFGGFFDAIGGTAITAFGRDGSVIGSVTNTQTGFEFLGLVTDDGQEKIAGLQFSLVGSEPAGFAIDNLRFARAGQVSMPNASVPEPASILGLLTLGAAGASSLLNRKGKKAA
jgi:PEP-CTERM motif